MLLLAAATELERKPLADLLGKRDDVWYLLTGVGLVEATLALTRFLESPRGKEVSSVINFGVAGGFANSGVKLLDICLAQRDCLAGLGICYGNWVEKFESLAIPSCFDADQQMLSGAVSRLLTFAKSCHQGLFITVNGVSATDERAECFWEQYAPLCESMEGAAVMRVCQDFNLPGLQVRAISNFVEKRNPALWRLEEAAQQCAKAVAHILDHSNLIV
jgi:futalosine hydrolase